MSEKLYKAAKYIRLSHADDKDDAIASCDIMEARINALKNAGIETEFHKYPNLGHGFALGLGTTAEGWIDDAERFWARQI